MCLGDIAQIPPIVVRLIRLIHYADIVVYPTVHRIVKLFLYFLGIV